MVDWIDPTPIFVSNALRDAVGGHPLVAEMLVRRGITTPSAARAFLNPSYYTPSSPQDLPDLDLAVDRIWHALERGERIAVWGDFDVDGQTATALLVEALCQISSYLNDGRDLLLSYQVPLRNQGHGIDLHTLDELLNRGVTLLITCDTGVDALTAGEAATIRGCDMIVTDHHDLPQRLPPAVAVVNPRRLPLDHPLRHLPGVGVVYKLVEGLFERAGYQDKLAESLDLVALGIVADVVIQVGDVRYLLQRGLDVLKATKRPGLRALVDVAELHLAGMSEEHIAYQLAPRLNALGRLSDANRGVELLLTQDLVQARTLAAEVDGLNYQRRLIAKQVIQAALTQVENTPSLLDHRALVLAGQNWHVGVLGLVAARLAEQFQRPAVVLSLPPEGPARGSARSVPGCDIRSALEQTSALLLRFGGHPGAAGLMMDPANVQQFRKALSRAVTAVWDSNAAVPGLQVDAYIGLEDVSLDLVMQLERLAPFGPGNPPVQLATHDLRIVDEAVIGREAEHRRLVVADEGGTQQTVIWWRGADETLPEGRFDLAYSVRSQDYRGDMRVQLEWIAARLREPAIALVRRPSRMIVDWRDEANPRVLLDRLAEDAPIVWAEGMDPDTLKEIGGANRLDLTQSSVLVIWTAPAGPAELAQVMECVDPSVVYLIAVLPPAGGFRSFTERLAGMVKHDLRTRGGQMSLSRIAAVLGHREVTVRTGLEWLTARGMVHVVETDGENFTLCAGGEPSANIQDVEMRLRRLLDETSAYRRYFRSTPPVALRIAA